MDWISAGLHHIHRVQKLSIAPSSDSQHRIYIVAQIRPYLCHSSGTNEGLYSSKDNIEHSISQSHPNHPPRIKIPRIFAPGKHIPPLVTHNPNTLLPELRSIMRMAKHLQLYPIPPLRQQIRPKGSTPRNPRMPATRSALEKVHGASRRQ